MDSAICAIFDQLVRDRPHRAAVYGLSEGVTRTFAELADDARAVAAALGAARLPPRPCLVSSVGNRTGFIALFLASLAQDATLVLLDGDATEPEIHDVVARLGADAVVSAIDAPAARLPSAIRLPAGLALMRQAGERSRDWQRSTETGPLVLKLTSGSTHQPKAVVSSEAHLIADGDHIAEAMGIRPDDIGLGTIPLSHAYGLGTLLLQMVLRGTTIALRDGFSAGSLAGDLDACAVTYMPGVPYIYDYLRRHGSGNVIAPLKLLISAGAPLDLGTLRFFKDQVGVKVHSLYGASETGAVTFDDTDDVGSSVSVGHAVPGTTVTLRTEPGRPPDEGRIFIRGSAVSERYALPADDDPATKFTDGGFLTGDLARLDARGHMHLCGRISRFVNVAGRKVHTEDIERVIASVSGVEEASVIGLAHPTRGQVLVACVRRRGPWVSADDVRAACSARLSAHKVPRRVVFADELPVDARGKVDRDAVLAFVTRTLEVEGA